MRNRSSAAVTQPELALMPSNSKLHTTSPVLSDYHNRWTPKSQTKRTQWTFYGHFTRG